MLNNIDYHFEVLNYYFKFIFWNLLLFGVLLFWILELFILGYLFSFDNNGVSDVFFKSFNDDIFNLFLYFYNYYINLQNIFKFSLLEIDKKKKDTINIIYILKI